MKKMNIAYSFDDGYAQHAGISIMSLLENNKDIEDIMFYIITASLTERNKEFINDLIYRYGRSVHYIDLETLTRNLQVNTAFNRSSYGRIFLSDVVNEDRIIYVDSDTVIAGSVAGLLDIDMNDILIAGVQDTVNRYYLTKINLPDSHRYICVGGIIVMNLNLWREMNIIPKCIDFIMRYNGTPPHNDQGTINKVCEGYIKILPPCYNVMPPMFKFSVVELKSLFRMKQYYSQAEIDAALRNPVVVHYTDEFFNRPWFVNCTHPLKDLYLKYLSQSPWRMNELKFKEISKNCKIQNFVYTHCSFLIYKLMIRFIEWKHMLLNRL